MSTQQTPPTPTATATVKQGRGIVKMVLSGDAIIVRGQPKGGPPPEKQINLSNIVAPRMGRRANMNVPDSVDTNDEPFAWHSRENLRKKCIGKEIYFSIDYAPNNDRCYGTVYLGTDANGENLNLMQIKDGMAEVRKVNVRADNTEHASLVDAEDQAKASGVGKWVEPRPEDAVRNISWTIDNGRNFVDSHRGEPIPVVIEHVRDGCTMRASLPSHHQITFILSGIKTPMIKRDPEDPKKEIADPYAAEAKFFVESRLLQRDVKIILEGVSNQNILLATVLHPNGNITEILLREGFARCVDWSIASYSQGAEKLRAMEKQAKERKSRIWKDYVAKVQEAITGEREFTGKVIQVINADAIAVKTTNGEVRTIHLASVRPPRYDDVVHTKGKDAPPEAPKGKSRPLYDVPYMFEAREFMRKKLIGKKVTVTIDYIKPSSAATDTLGAFPERTCATVRSGGMYNISLKQGVLYKIMRELLKHAKQSIHSSLYLPFLQRAGKSEAVVEYVFGGSRLKLFLPKETCLITFLLAGIDCPRGARNGAQGVMEADAYSDEALALTKENCMHREVSVEVETIDRAGNFIGWLFVEGVNMSQLLLENGLSKIHFTAERSNFYRSLQAAEEKAKTQNINIWSGYVEPVAQVKTEEPTERKTNYRSVYVTEVTPQLHLFCQFSDAGSKLDTLMEKMRGCLIADPPLPGSHQARRGEFCVARFTEDDMWYRARVEKVDKDKLHVHYIDYGNKEIIPSNRVASLPGDYNTGALLPQAHEYSLALVNPPEDPDSLADAFRALCGMVGNVQFKVNVEYKDGVDFVTLLNQDETLNVGKALIGDGFCTVAKRGEKRLQKMMTEFYAEQSNAKKQHLNLWRYGDITEDDASEFGYSKK
ncbi:staphylococcal nuclease domain-containing protein 1 [Ciona intestinalis]